MRKHIALLGALLGLGFMSIAAETNKPPIRIAIIGLVHSHVHGFLPNVLQDHDVQLVGIVESNPKLVAANAARYHLDTNLFFATLTELLAKTNPQAVATFTSTFDHKSVVETCASRGVHVMVEKPLAVNMEHANAIATAAKRGGIHVLVNYETTWYPANHAAYDMVANQNSIGELRKVVVHDGHRGPKEIGCPPEFLGWLTDPVLNGGGALSDFGCYGADLMTWLMQGQRPTSVFAVTQHLKPDVYPKVEDEATIVLTYPMAQAILQASWNWPVNRKDMELYGQTGQILIPQRDLLRVQRESVAERAITPAPLTGAQSGPLPYLTAVVRGEMKPSGLSSLEVNMTVVEILDAARKSAATGKRVDLPAKSR